MKPGNIIMVDAGTYNLNSDIILTLADSGVTIEGYNSCHIPDARRCSTAATRAPATSSS